MASHTPTATAKPCSRETPISNANNMLMDKMPLPLVAKYTGLLLEEVEELAKKLNT